MKKKSLYLFIITFSAVVLLLLLLHPFEKKSSASKNVYEKIKDKEAVHYVIIGDSIGRGSGASTKEATWFHLLDQKIKNQYPIPLSRSSVVQSGATAFEGLYKFKNTKIKQADLVFIVFGENDRKYMDNNQFALFYEQLLLEVKTRFPSAELITITESCLENEAFAQTIAAVSKNYLATNIDMRVPFKQSGYSTKELTKDFIHPNDKGYQIYSEEIYSVLKNNLKKNKPTSNIVMDPKKKSSYLLQTKYAFSNKDASFIKKNGYYTSEKKMASIDYTFKGSYVGVNVIRSENGGMMDVYIDNKYTTTVSTWWPFEKKRSLYISSGLSEGNHTISFRLTGKKSSENHSNQHKIQLSSIIVNSN